MHVYLVNSLPAPYPVPRTVLCFGVYLPVPVPAQTLVDVILPVRLVPKQLFFIQITQRAFIIMKIIVTLAVLPPVSNNICISCIYTILTRWNHRLYIPQHKLVYVLRKISIYIYSKWYNQYSQIYHLSQVLRWNAGESAISQIVVDRPIVDHYQEDSRHIVAISIWILENPYALQIRNRMYSIDRGVTIASRWRMCLRMWQECRQDPTVLADFSFVRQGYQRP